jgi:Tol biopolymer transport system component
MWGPLDERRRLTDERESSWAISGCLRIARVGDRMFSLFAPEDSSDFRILRAETVTEADIQMSGILLELALRDAGSGHVVWKDLSIKAERLKYLAPDRKPTLKLFAMNADGGNLRQITEPKFGLNHLGSPEFSADSSRIVMGMSTGSTTTSHVVVLDRDGSKMTDLGRGCMPSLSKDGKTIVFSDPGAGIVQMDADGKNRKTLERSGWGVQYSPDGKHIAYASRSNITLIDPQTRSMVVYHIDKTNGEISLRSVRNVHWDMQMDEFNGKNPLPREIRSLLQTR